MLAALFAAALAAPLHVEAVALGQTLVHPGVAGGVGVALVDGPHGAVTAGGRVGGWVHARNHQALYAMPDVAAWWQPRDHAWIGARGRFGLTYTRVPGVVWVEGDTGPEETRDTGRLQAMPSVGVELGWRTRGWSPVLRLEAHWRAPVAGLWLPGEVLSLGVTRRLGGTP